MKQSTDILDKARRRDGMTVPEGYFADFSRRMAASLPERPELESPDSIAVAGAQRTLWQRVRPYVYLAAMFAGIWLMLQLFTLISHPGDLRPMDANPVMAEAFSDDRFMLDYIVEDAGVDQWDLIDEMTQEGLIDSLDFSGFIDPSTQSISFEEEE